MTVHKDCDQHGKCIACAKEHFANNPAYLGRVARDEMPACFTPTRAAFVALAQLLFEKTVN